MANPPWPIRPGQTRGCEFCKKMTQMRCFSCNALCCRNHRVKVCSEVDGGTEIRCHLCAEREGYVVTLHPVYDDWMGHKPKEPDEDTREMRKATLMIPVYYDGKKTDGESVASAFDTLLETAMSTPRILDECANPLVGEFSLEADTHWPEEGDDTRYIVRLGPVDGKLFAEQRQLVLYLTAGVNLNLQGTELIEAEATLEGLTSLLDVIADQLHDRYGVPCLLEEDNDDNGDEETGEEEAGEAAG